MVVGCYIWYSEEGPRRAVCGFNVHIESTRESSRRMFAVN